MEQNSDSPAVATARSAASPEACPELGRGAELNPLPRAANALVPQPALEPAPEPALDAHGFDPSEYKWVPVLRRPRSDGWTPQRQVEFIAALADCGCVEQAAREVHMSARSCYRLRRSPGAENFAAAWDAALHHAARKLVDLAFDRAIHGTDEPVFDKHGNRIGRHMRQNDRLLMFLLRAYMPERFRHAHRDMRAPQEPLPPAAPPMAQALRLLEPAAPPEPHKLMPPDELEDALFIADGLDGRLPHWHRGRGDAEPNVDLADPEFEQELEALKHQAWRPPPEADEAGDEDGRDAFQG